MQAFASRLCAMLSASLSCVDDHNTVPHLSENLADRSGASRLAGTPACCSRDSLHDPLGNRWSCREAGAFVTTDTTPVRGLHVGAAPGDERRIEVIVNVVRKSPSTRRLCHRPSRGSSVVRYTPGQECADRDVREEMVLFARRRSIPGPCR